MKPKAYKIQLAFDFRRKPKSPSLAPLSPKNHPLAIRDLVDQDYVKDLDHASKRWLAQFNDEYYRADFRYISPLHGQEQQRELQTAKKRQQRHGRLPPPSPVLEDGEQVAWAELWGPIPTLEQVEGSPAEWMAPESNAAARMASKAVQVLAKKLERNKDDPLAQRLYRIAVKRLVEANRAVLSKGRRPTP